MVEVTREIKHLILWSKKLQQNKTIKMQCCMYEPNKRSLFFEKKRLNEMINELTKKV